MSEKTQMIKFCSFWLFLFTQALIFPFEKTAAQSCGEYQIIEMQQNYKTGKFTSVIANFNQCKSMGFETNKQREEAFATVAKAYLELEQVDSSKQLVSELLALNNNYEPTSRDPIYFKKIVHEIQNSLNFNTVMAVSKKKEKIIDAPATVVVVTEQEIHERGYIDLEQLFSDLPGFDISRTYGITYSNIYQRGYRSDNTDRTLFLIDGVEDNDLWTGGVYLSRQYPISNVERVEVVYGPASTMYGANAFLGVVNVITKKNKPDKANKAGISGKSEIGYGTFNTKYIDVNLFAYYKSITASFTFRKFSSDEMDLSGYPEFNYDPAEYDKVDYVTSLSVNSKTAAKFARNANTNPNFNTYFTINRNEKGDTVAVIPTQVGVAQARAFDKKAIEGTLNGKQIAYSNISDHIFFLGKIQIADFTIGYQTWRSINGTANYYHDNKRAGSDNGSVWVPAQGSIYLMYEKDIASNLSFYNLSQYRVSELDDESKTIEVYNYSNKRLGPESLINKQAAYWAAFYSSSISNQFRNETKITLIPNSWINIITGIEARSSVIQGDYRQSTNDTISAIESGIASADLVPGGNDFQVFDIGAYLQTELLINSHIKLNLGGRYDYNQIRATGGYGTQFNPRLALIVNYKGFVIKAIYARAFQNASVWKKYSTTAVRAPNPTISPEIAKNYELNLNYEISKTIEANIVGYIASYEGIASVRDGLLIGNKTQQYQPIGELSVQGLQVTLNAKWPGFSTWANYTYTSPYEKALDAEGKFTHVEKRVADIASHRFNLGFSATILKQIQLQIRYNYIGARPVGIGTTVPDNPGLFPAVGIVNASIGCNRIFSGFGLQLIVNNALNENYFDPGIRIANATTYAYRTPQRSVNFILRANYIF